MVKKYKKLYNLVNPFPVVYIIKLFWRKSGNSRFPLKPLVQEYDILKEINSYFHIFVQVQEQTIFNVLILGYLDFLQQSFITSTTGGANSCQYLISHSILSGI